MKRRKTVGPYAENMHDFELLGIPGAPLLPLHTEPAFKWVNLGVIAAIMFASGVILGAVIYAAAHR